MMKLLVSSCVPLLVLFLTLSCGQDFNSNSYDGVGNIDCPNPADTLLCESLTILHTSCVRCHNGEHASWAVYESIADYVNAGLVDATGNIEGSSLITRLRHHNPPGDMPPVGYSLTPNQYSTLVDWVESM